MWRPQAGALVLASENLQGCMLFYGLYVCYLVIIHACVVPIVQTLRLPDNGVLYMYPQHFALRLCVLHSVFHASVVLHHVMHEAPARARQ